MTLIKRKAKGKFQKQIPNRDRRVTKLTFTQLLRTENRHIFEKDIVILERDGLQSSICFPMELFVTELGGWEYLRSMGFETDRIQREYMVRSAKLKDNAMENL